MTCHCWKCGEAVVFAPGARIGAREACPRCDADLHCCKNCDFYDPAKHNQCNESQAEWVRDKEAANYCDYFRPALRGASLASPPASSLEDAKKKFNSLFRP
ncbi:MAG: hypothetical protein ACRD2G_07205 [Terriglobia bacterium]